MPEKNTHVRKVLGDILVGCKVVSQAQVDAALAEQRRSGKLFGEALLDLGFISEDDLGWALSAQLSVPYIDLTAAMADRNAVQLLGPDLMRRHQMIPLVRVGDALTVAVADPTNREAIDEVETATGLTVQISIASPRRIARILDELIGPEEDLGHEAGDLLLKEMTRPWREHRKDTPPDFRPLAVVFSTALKNRVREIHLDPLADHVRVRFRRGADLEPAGKIDLNEYRSTVRRLKEGLPSGEGSTERLTSWKTAVAFAAGVLDLRVTILGTTGGDSMVVEMSEKKGPRSLPELGLDEAWIAEVRERQNRGYGLLIVAGPPGEPADALFTALCRDLESETRRVVLMRPGPIRRKPGMMELADGGDPSLSLWIRDQILVSSWVDAMIVDDLNAGIDFDAALTAGAIGKTVLARMVAPDAVTALAMGLERGASKVMMMKGLTGIVEAALEPGGAMTASLLAPSEALNRAIESYSGPSALLSAALSSGYRQPSSRRKAA
jgi:hypothetical protein